MAWYNVVLVTFVLKVISVQMVLAASSKSHKSNFKEICTGGKGGALSLAQAEDLIVANIPEEQANTVIVKGGPDTEFVFDCTLKKRRGKTPWDSVALAITSHAGISYGRLDNDKRILKGSNQK